MEIKTVRDKITRDELIEMAKDSFGDMVKAVVDVEREIMAVGGGMHADAEEALLRDGSRQENLWGINIFPGRGADHMLEFESLINIRPRDNNRTMEIQDESLRSKIQGIVTKLVSV